ncbi:hypothetical protein LIA77_07699 [Sarocladium implicatum]|nr:hypothetical protein LIA77_07699 [Sarocladium implicatum]
MASRAIEAMTPRPTVLSPASPSELLAIIITSDRHPSTLVVGATRQDFLDGLARDVLPPPEPLPESVEEPVPQTKHSLLINTLLQIAVSRHIRVVFVPSVTHLRAWMTVFSPSHGQIPGPPAPRSTDTPSLIVYGLVELHKDTSEWSAQGVGGSVATFVEAAVRHRFKPVLVEPRRRDCEGSEAPTEDQAPAAFGDEKLPLLKGTAMRDDGTWAGRTVELYRVLGRWFSFEEEVKT